MIIRIVKMNFDAQHLSSFLQNFEKHKESIRNFEGCSKLELLQEKANPNVYFTYSWWESEEALENYRKSDLFRGVWQQTKQYFSSAPQAWSLVSKVNL